MLSNLISQCTVHSQRTLHWIVKHISSDGELKGYPEDLVCYYKLPYLLTLSGQTILANHVLDHIKSYFFTAKNSLTFDIKKTENPLMAKFWGYVLGWIAIAAQKLGRFDISYPLQDYLLAFQSQDHGGFATSGPWGITDDAMDIITSAQLGRLSLYFGLKNEALKTGDFLGWNINNQTDLENSLYLFVNNEKSHVKQYLAEQEMIYVIKKHSPQQAYFMIGLPMAYLVELYSATNDKIYLEYAKQYADFALNCHESIKSFHFSHKIAWAMSLLYKVTKNESYLTLCKEISNYLMQTQDQEGIWLKAEGNVTAIDQSVENAIWLHEIATNLS